MIYQNPQLLYFLFAIAIPIIIHLFSFRKHKTIYFSSIQFLKEVKEEKQKKSNLKNILLLLSRILAISFLVIAFSKPFIPNETQNQITNDIIIYIDNSFSMDAENEHGKLLAQAKEKAKIICNSYPKESNFWLITNDFLTKHNNRLGLNLIHNYIDELSTTAYNKNLTQILNRQKNSKTKNRHFYIISDMQKNSLQIEKIKEIDSTINLFIIPIKTNNINNISIDSCWTNQPILKNINEITLFAIINNHSKTEINEQAIFLEINGKQKSQQYLNIKANNKQTISFTFLPDDTTTQLGVLRINDHPIIFDNNCYFILKTSKKREILCINETKQNRGITNLFSNDTALSNFKNISVNNINFNTIKEQDFIIINEVSNISSGLSNSLKKFVINGGSIVLIPPTTNIKTYNKCLKNLNISTLSEIHIDTNRINKLNIQHQLYKNVFKGKLSNLNYPVTTKYHKIITNNQTNSIALLTQENNNVFLEVFQESKGLIYLFNSPLRSSFNNFTKHALFVPTLLNMASLSTRIESIYNIIDSESFFTSKEAQEVSDFIHVKNNTTDIIPTQKTYMGKKRFYTQNQITKNGIYQIEANKKVIGSIAYNYATKESNMHTLQSNDIKKWKNDFQFENISIINEENSQLKNIIIEIQKGKELWKIALALSILFFGIEILLIKIIQ